MNKKDPFDFQMLLGQLFEQNSPIKAVPSEYSRRCLSEIQKQLSSGQYEWLLGEVAKNFPGSRKDSEVQNWTLFKRFLKCLPEKSFCRLIIEIRNVNNCVMHQSVKENILFQLEKTES